MPVNEDILVAAVTYLGGRDKVVSSKEVKEWLDKCGITYDRPGRGGGHLEQADHDAARNLRLTRWEQINGRHMVGWSIPNCWRPAPLRM